MLILKFSSKMTSVKRSGLYLIGKLKPQITGAKLPSIGDVLKVLFYNLRWRKFNLADSTTLVSDEVLVFWRKARIPTQNENKVKEKIGNLYERYRTLQKHKSRSSDRNKKAEQDFIDLLDDLFDIARQDALQAMKIEEDKEFLKKQREKGRPGNMMGVDLKLAHLESRRQKRLADEEKRRQKNIESGTSQADNSCKLIIIVFW